MTLKNSHMDLVALKSRSALSRMAMTPIRILGLQLLLLPSNEEERDRISKIWRYCTHLPPPRSDRWTLLEAGFETMMAEETKLGTKRARRNHQ